MLAALALGVLAVPAHLEGAATAADRHERSTSRRAATPLITITDDTRALPRVPATMVGGNLRWVGGADGALDPATGRIRPEVADLARRIGVRAIRYSGGTVANLFDYRKALTRPGCQTSGGFAETRYAPVPAADSQYTIPKHAAFARRTAATTNVMLPMINTNLPAVKGYVKSIVRATGRRHVVVEIGNEPTLSDQRYWRATGLTERLDDYILGGKRTPRGERGDHRLFPAKGCDLLHPAKADGTSNQRYRPRFTPISLSTPPVVTVAGRVWTYVPDLGAAGPRARVFTTKQHRTVVAFGNGRHGRLPRGAMAIDYTAGKMLGFKQMYRALKTLRRKNITVDVCSSWATPEFVARMKKLRLGYDCLAPHTYAVIREQGPKASLAGYRMTGRLSTALLAQLRTAIGPKRFLVVSEFGGVNVARPEQGGLFVRDLLLGMQLVGQIDQGVRISNLSNFNTFFYRYGARFRPSGVAYLENLVRKMFGQRPVEMTGLPKALVGIATRRGARTSLLVVNPSFDRSLPVRIHDEGRSGAACVGVRTLRAAPGRHVRPATADERPVSVRPTRSFSWAGAGPHSYTFPSHSITLLSVNPKRGSTCPAVNWLS